MACSISPDEVGMVGFSRQGRRPRLLPARSMSFGGRGEVYVMLVVNVQWDDISLGFTSLDFSLDEIGFRIVVIYQRCELERTWLNWLMLSLPQRFKLRFSRVKRTQCAQLRSEAHARSGLWSTLFISLAVIWIKGGGYLGESSRIFHLLSSSGGVLVSQWRLDVTSKWGFVVFLISYMLLFSCLSYWCCLVSLFFTFVAMSFSPFYRLGGCWILLPCCAEFSPLPVSLWLPNMHPLAVSVQPPCCP